MKAFFTVLFSFIFAGSVFPEEIQTINVEVDKGIYRVDVDVILNAPLKEVRHVITDYNHLTWISGAIQKSMILDSPGKGVYIVFLRTKACFGIICREFDQVQRVSEISETEIVAETLPLFSDMEFNLTRWELQAVGASTRLRWTTEMDPKFWIPPLFGPAAVKSGLRKQGVRTAKGIEKLARERLEPRG
ncbi:MAG: SRPBCC family protein [Gammaproteobacteria bacterium]|nr:SRPBCC family protein [Gammaproteobacteria bacterium]